MRSVRSLPTQPTSFVGRAATVRLVCRRLAEHRVVSLVGPGGCGKTRLAVEVARRTTAFQPVDVNFVDLSGLSDPELVPGTVLSALGLSESLGEGPLEALTSRLAERGSLILLDNCEHLVEACAALVGTLTRECRGVRFLATSRECLGASGEGVVDLEGLELPELGGRRDEAWLLQSEAGRLFMDRARMARAGFQLHAGDALAVARICRRLDGIPLALEMAATRVRVMSVQAIDEGLSDRFRLLTGTGRGGPARHRTLLASIEWSCGLLSRPERQLLDRLSVFASGFSFAAAEAVCAGRELGRAQVFGLLVSLVEKSLVQASPDTDRLRLHETTHAYAAAALAGNSCTAAMRDRHLNYFADLAKLIDQPTRMSEVSAARRKLEPELGNLRAALSWSVESKQFGVGVKLMCSMAMLLNQLGLSTEAVALCGPFLSADLEPSLRAELLFTASTFWHLKDPPKSLRLASELVALGRSLGDRRAQAAGLLRTAAIKVESHPEEALEAATAATDLAQEAGEQGLILQGAWAKGWALLRLGRPQEALQLGEQALQDRAAWDWPDSWRTARSVFSAAAMRCGRLEQALEDPGLRARSQSDPMSVAAAESTRAEALAFQGRPEAVDAIERALSLLSASGDTYFEVNFQATRGRIWILQGRQDEGYRALDAAVAKLESWGLLAMCVENRAILAEVAVRRGDLAGAHCQLAASSWRLPRAIEPAGAPVLRAAARLARAEGEPGRAYGLACDGLQAAFEGGHVLWMVDLLELAAIICCDVGNHAEGARMLGAAEAQRELTGYARAAPVRDELVPVVANLRNVLGEGPFEQALSEGRRLSLEEAIAYARRRRGSRHRERSGWESLTRSELRVASLVGQQLTNVEIAHRLFISTPTVKSHLNRVFAKLGVANRGQLATEVNRHLIS